jgi:hypothetical protein
VSRSKPEHITYDDFIEIKEGVKAQSIRQGNKIFLHRVSDGKMEKGKAMVAKARDRMKQYAYTSITTGVSAGVERLRY